ncbi:MAG: hypothetical protein QOI94_2621 [Acidobacteriaceae bacterium]|nr:hypothetical protein [Acidobacteriaceae bacterium]
MYLIWYYTCELFGPTVTPGLKRIEAIFYRTAGGEPVRDWLKGLHPIEDRKQIGVDIKTVEFGWPIGMPVCRPVGGGLYEVRSNLAGDKIARVIFYVDVRGRMVLLHGFIKKTQKTPQADLELARKNKRLHEAELKGRK